MYFSNVCNDSIRYLYVERNIIMKKKIFELILVEEAIRLVKNTAIFSPLIDEDLKKFLPMIKLYEPIGDVVGPDDDGELVCIGKINLRINFYNLRRRSLYEIAEDIERDIVELFKGVTIKGLKFGKVYVDTTRDEVVVEIIYKCNYLTNVEEVEEEVKDKTPTEWLYD